MKTRKLFPTHSSLAAALAVLAALLALFAAPSAHAAALTWIGGSGDWNDGIPGGWSAAWNNATPDSGTFTGAGGTVTLLGDITSGALTNTAGNYTLQSDGATVRTITANGTIVPGSGNTTTIGSNVTITRAASATVDGNTTATSTLNINSDGKLTTTVLNAIITIKETTANVNTGGTIDSASSMVVGNTATGGTLNVQGGTVTIGTATTGSNLVLANAAGATGNLKITGGSLGFAAGVTSGAGNLRVGPASGATATGTFDLEGGIVEVNRIYEGTAAHSSTLNLSNATIKARSDQTDFIAVDNVWIKSGGVTFDSNGKAITVKSNMLTHATSTGGGLTLTNSGGSGTLTLSGANTYTGPTTITAGKLVTTTKSTGAGSYSVSDNATLEVQINGAGTSLTNSSLTLGTTSGSTNTFVLGSGNPTAPVVRVTGALTLNNPTINVTGSGLTGSTVDLLTYSSGGAGTFTVGSLPTVTGYAVALTNDTSVNKLQLVFTAIPMLTWAVGDSNWDTTSDNWTGSATKFTDGAAVIFNDSASGISPITVNLTATRTPNAVIVTQTKDYIFTGSAVAGSSSVLDKSGSSKLTLANDNTYGGGTIISGGTVQVGNGGSAGSLGTGAVANNGATLAFNRSDAALNVSNNISGTGALQQNGTGTVTLSGTNTYSGGTTVATGTLITALNTGLNSLGTNTVNISSGATNQVNNLNITGGEPVLTNTFTGSGRLIVNFAADTITPRNTRISGMAGFTGTLELANSGAGTTGDKWSNPGVIAPGLTVQVDSGSTLFFWDNTTSTFAGIMLSGAGNSENRGALRLDTVVLNGPVTLMADSAIATGPSDTGTLNGNISATGVNTLTVGHIISSGDMVLNGILSNGSGTLSLDKTTTGKLTLTGANTYSGATTINGGTLVLANDAAINFTSGLTIAAGATLDTIALTVPPPSSIPLTASGTGTTVGYAAAAILGVSNFPHDLGTRQVTLNFDGANPALYLSGGTLNLNNNPFTINGAVLTNGVYTIIAQSDAPDITGSVAASTVNGTALAGKTGTVSLFGNTVVLTVTSAGPSGPATLTNSVSGGVLSLSWPAGQGWRLEQQTNALTVGLSTNWVEAANSSVSSTNITIDSTLPTVFYRLVYP